MQPIFFDTETTGTRIDKDRIIEIAAYNPITKKSFTSFVNPEMPIPAEATAISNISEEMVKDALTFHEIGKQFINFCQGDVVLIAHNNDNFDKPILTAEFSRCNIDIPPKWKYLDTLKWARKYRPDLPRHSLQYLREVYGICANQAHRALDDTMVLYEIFSLMIDDLSWPSVYELYTTEKSSASLRMPFGKYQGKSLQDVPKSYISWLCRNNVFDKEENQQLKASFEELGLLEKGKT